jgi:hypothetical protein
MGKNKHRSFKDSVESKRDFSREAAIENTPIRLDGQGESQLIKDIAGPKFQNASNEEAVDMALMLQQIVRGQASILDNQSELQNELRQLKEKMKKYDDDARAFNDNQTKFMADINQQADKLRITDPSKKGELAAMAMNMEREAQIQARAEASSAQVSFAKMVANAPKVTVVGRGHVESGILNGQPIVRLTDDEVRIKHTTWILPTGIPKEVPNFVASRYQQMLRDREEASDRQSALSADRNNGEMINAGDVEKEMKRIDQKYGTQSDSVRV